MMVIRITLVLLVIGSATSWTFDISDIYDALTDIHTYSKTLMKDFSKTLLEKDCQKDPDICRNVVCSYVIFAYTIEVV